MKNCPTREQTFPDEVDFCPHDGAHLVPKADEAEAKLAAQLAGQFRIIRCLGAGGMGTVFLAEQIAVGNRPVALKVLARQLLDDPDFLQRFRNEAGSTGRICHPNVVTIYESGQAADGTPFIAMEYLEGRTLRDWIEARGPIPALECAEIIQQAARGLNAAHKLGIIHRDLKPDNIFLTRDAEGELLVKLVDFGIAKLRESTSHTMAGSLLGTPAYFSYEQASGMSSEQLDARSDIYSFGIVAYEMLAGSLPFESSTTVGFISKHLTEKPPPFRAIQPDLPSLPGIERAVMKALAKNRDERYASALEFARDFAEGARAGVPGEAEDSSDTQATRIGVMPPLAPEIAPHPHGGLARQALEPDTATKIAPPPPETVKMLSRAAAAAAGAATGPLVPQEEPGSQTPPPTSSPSRSVAASDPEATKQHTASEPPRHSVVPPPARTPGAQAHSYSPGYLPKAHAVVQYKDRRHWGNIIVLILLLAALVGGVIWFLAPKIHKLSLSSQRETDGTPALAAIDTENVAPLVPFQRPQ
jgi:serine/threonine protein kinase